MSKKEIIKRRKKPDGKIITMFIKREILDDTETFWRLRGYPNRSAYIQHALKKLNYPDEK